MLGIFITNVFRTIVEASLNIFDLHQQFFADAKIFESERLHTYNLIWKLAGFCARVF